MRYSVVNGNGCVCDKCGKALSPDEAIKLKFLVVKDSTGAYSQINKMDLCKHCYDRMISEYQILRREKCQD